MDDNREQLKQLILKVFEKASWIVERLAIGVAVTENLEEAAIGLRHQFSIYAALKNNPEPGPILDSLASAIEIDTEEGDSSGVEHLTEVLEILESDDHIEAFGNAYVIMDTFSAYLDARKMALN